ncbi:uncharacterized protein LOC106069892 isoform X1 [Biomphalaria glabrata]|uniref:Uncharacterized protein LOC106069892 isoform X1 n=1 Tax=Biomphalaria glabrata TaxID=6526 RepID=A0A9W3BND6_BIOGL|nr:uncharacterized protein LOC106069892 isoform X1 [Biomphalaria glabrata]XP_055901099.1 uncharacterized protein LOC106069892 isoform X1 [Biomphalaria glabrata]XP_055901100.1 uncharacterized protein LOC106069892 isoform X1 [Biomphalaria glabrata]XP_055901101.1 uncharacterized protein LOC106069892 isoform X1 [Biomphalaria glabrata]XP_055901102.1 uncharacterized protein LOC106069892 isoform X1 [Biomphalaria glabrata]
MDPNHWNTYNLQYGHSTTGGLTPTHSSLNRLDLTSGLGLSHQLQASTTPIGSRSVTAIPTVNYSLGMPLLDTMSTQQSHKSMSIGQGQLLFDSQLRVAPEQQSPTFSRYESSKALARDSVTRTQLLEAARLWPPSSSLYNHQFLQDVPVSNMGNLSVSPGSGSGNITSKSNQLQMHDPPPAHSSNTARIAQRSSHSTEILYGRNTESILPSSLAQIYSSNTMGKQSFGNNSQQQTHRLTEIHSQPSYSSHNDIEDLSSNSQGQLYGSYANISDPQEFSSAQMSGDLSYEAVSPAPPMNENLQVGQEQSNFSIVHFPDLANLTSEHAHTLADKFQENDFRLKMDSNRLQQQDILSSPISGQRQDLGMTLKIPKDSLHMLSMQVNQRSNQFQSNIMMSQGMSMLPSPGNTMNINHSSSLSQVTLNNSLTTSSMQQAQTPIPIQALADSTTKPKRTRNRKKKDPPQSNSPVNEIKKSSSQPMPLSQHNILNMPPASPHISTLPMGVHVSQASHMQQPNFRNSGSSNQFTSRDVHRAQTPSMPQNYSLQDHQNHGYAPSQSPKIATTPNQNLMRTQGDFVLPNRMGNDKTSSTFKLTPPQQRKSTESTIKSSNFQSSQSFRSNIPDNQQHIQSFVSLAGLMSNNGQQRSSPMQENHSNLSRLTNFAEHPSQHKIVSQMSPLGQPSPQGADNSYGGSKAMIGHVGHMGSQSMAIAHSPIDSRPVSVDHSYDPGHNPGLIDSQDTHQFHLDFSGQPFLEQLVGVQQPLTVPSSGFGHSSAESGETVFTTLVSPSESTRIQQQNDSASNDGNFRPTYHGEAVHEIRPVGAIGSNLNMDDVSFNAFFDTQRSLDQDGSQSYAASEPEKMTLTFMPHVVDDDELGHFTLSTMAQPVVMVKKGREDPAQKRDSFQDSFMSYLQGHKQETLSSVSSSAVTKKPQLPKYIPEPRRPRPTVQRKESSNFSDSEDALRDSHFSDNDSSHKSDSDREGYSVQRTSELAVKITLPKSKKRSRFGPFAESTLLKDSMRKNKEGVVKRRRRRQKHKENPDLGEDFWPGNGSEEEDGKKFQPEVPLPSPPPMRTSIGRKAKEKCLEKTAKQKNFSGSDSSTEEEYVPYKGKSNLKNDDSDKNYDSDKDPVWMPFAVDLKQGHDFEDKRKKVRRSRVRMSSTKSSKSSSRRSSQTASVSTSPAVQSTDKNSGLSQTGEIPSADQEESHFQIGMYMIEKKDLQNFESYPIWRLEPGNLIRKFEMCTDNNLVQHVAVGTFSNWVKSMETQFEPIKVKEVQSDSLRVEVIKEYRPKPPSNKRLEVQYEDDPLVETFNVYLQVLLSQALEPTFLSAIHDADEKFYVDPLNQIDCMIENKCQEITRQAHWKASFLECLHRCPLMKEIDRPNLKQPCQASENSSPPTIKSVVLYGTPYDRFLLTELPNHTSDSAQEFMIGKVAAHYVRTYHNLHHFKYWLRQRCEAKVKMMKESNRADSISNEIILDKCLENTTWVLSLFDNLKNLLKFGGEMPR